MKMFLTLIFLDYLFIMLIDVKMPTIVGISTFMSSINYFVLSIVENEKEFSNLKSMARNYNGSLKLSTTEHFAEVS